MATYVRIDQENEFTFAYESGTTRTISIEWLDGICDKIGNTAINPDQHTYDPDTNLDIILLGTTKALLLDRGSSINREITTKYRIVPFDADPWHIGFKHKPVTASTPTITLPEVLSQLSARTAIASVRQLYMRLAHLNRSVQTTHTDSASGQPGMLSTPHQMYVYLRWNPALTSSAWAMPANTWTDLPFNSMGGQRNFNSFN